MVLALFGRFSTRINIPRLLAGAFLAIGCGRSEKQTSGDSAQLRGSFRVALLTPGAVHDAHFQIGGRVQRPRFRAKEDALTLFELHRERLPPAGLLQHAAEHAGHDCGRRQPIWFSG